MRLTLHADYAFRVLIYLAAHRERLSSTAEISKAYGISRHHLVKVVQSLGRYGFIELRPGRTGGLLLRREPAKISLGDVLRATEPDFNLVECFDKETNTCPIVPVCSLKPLLAKANRAFLAELDGYTLADLVGQSAKKRISLYFLTSKKKKRKD